ncbi:hypothetical protein Tco_1316965 [Tanacetum coccineum]
MVKAIDKLLFERRLMRNLEKFVGGRDYGNDLNLKCTLYHICAKLFRLIDAHMKGEQMVTQNRRDLPRDIPLDSVVVLKYEKRSKSGIKGKVPTEMELVLEQTQQGTSYEVSVDPHGFKGIYKDRRGVASQMEENQITQIPSLSSKVPCDDGVIDVGSSQASRLNRVLFVLRLDSVTDSVNSVRTELTRLG